jgi:aspartyl-tRNA(Asn)/glutamyl-tRNA(Gln) amidotransferase subunit C
MLTKEDVQKIAELSNLYLTSEEEAIFSHQLGTIIAHISKLNQLDTADVNPTFCVVKKEGVMREDEPVKSQIEIEEEFRVKRVI